MDYRLLNMVFGFRVVVIKSLIIFIGIGEYMDEFEVFEIKIFVSWFLGEFYVVYII